MSSWGLLDDKEENELHKSRLLNVEEKPFKRVTKRLNTLHSLVISRARPQEPTPPPESNGTGEQHNDATPSPTADPKDLAQLREDITLDFAAFDNSIARIQLLLSANERERERYAADRENILNTSQTVRDNTTQLRIQLDQAKATLEQRRKFDELADQITRNPALRTRAEQASNLRKLEEEIAELEAESRTYAVTWHERRDQFSRIMDESMRLRRLIRDEKEEVERREGMDDGEAEPGQTPRPGTPGGNATPRPESGLMPKGGAESGEAAGTPRPLSTAGGRTPARGESPAPSTQDNQSFLKPTQTIGDSFSQVGSLAASREGTAEPKAEQDEQTQQEERKEETREGDVEMVDSQGRDSEPDSPLSPPPEDVDMPQITVDDTMDTT
ncbi:Tho complex subunit 7-domain-containing protein [Podospora australis]|uniref:Tho complex subunit 7-domain-containing protein n=1 Tax=Podospora australis TaxID=1536484 RepID=A0AAN6X104_9PEZI|nr:Tho complex subunit 7-domain-containing protein [Podospora australis]